MKTKSGKKISILIYFFIISNFLSVIFYFFYKNNIKNCINKRNEKIKFLGNCIKNNETISNFYEINQEYIVKILNMNKVSKTFEGHTDCVYSVCFSPDGKYIAIGSSDNTIKLWDIKTIRIG